MHCMDKLLGNILGPPGQWYTSFGHIWFGRSNKEAWGKNCEIKNRHFMYFSLLSYQRSVQLYETDISIETLAALQSDSLSFVDRQTDKSQDQALKRHLYLGRINNLCGYCCPNYFARIGPDCILSFKVYLTKIYKLQPHCHTQSFFRCTGIYSYCVLE